MKFVSCITLVLLVLLITPPTLAKRPKKEKPQQNTQNVEESIEQTDSQGYRPNPVILAGVGQIMNGALSIAQDPHSRPNVGHSVAHMIHGIMSIIIEKVANKKINLNDWDAVEECFNDLCIDISKEITEIIETKNLAIPYN